MRTGRRPFLRGWSVGYRLAARAFAALLTRGEPGASVYARAGTGTSDIVPGISDIDLVVVVPEDPAGADVAPARVRRRYERAIRALPLARRVLDVPCVYDDAQLRDLAGASYPTYGIERTGTEDGTAYRPDAALLDRRRLIERPGLYGDLRWRRLRGPERRPPVLERDVHTERLAAWLELVFWWRFAFEACVEPSRGHAALLCVKLVAEPARVWLWLAHGDAPRTRREVLERAAEWLPDEAPALQRAIALQSRLHELPQPPLEDAMGALVRLSSRVAKLVTDAAFAEGSRAVVLQGAEPAALTAGAALTGAETGRYEHPARALPLCDWRALAVPTHADESFAIEDGDPGDPALVAQAALERTGGAHRALAAPSLLVLPLSALERPLPRSVSCPASDPVSFALAGGETEAMFPNVPGWSVVDVARRAVAEQRPRVMGAPVGGDTDRESRVLLAAARAALLRETAHEGAPTLPVTLSATARLLADRMPGASEHAAALVEALEGRVAPSQAAVRELRRRVMDLSPFRPGIS